MCFTLYCYLCCDLEFLCEGPLLVLPLEPVEGSLWHQLPRLHALYNQHLEKEGKLSPIRQDLDILGLNCPRPRQNGNLFQLEFYSSTQNLVPHETLYKALEIPSGVFRNLWSVNMDIFSYI